VDSNFCRDQGERESEPEGRSEEFVRTEFAGGEEDADDGTRGGDAEGDAVGTEHPLAMGGEVAAARAAKAGNQKPEQEKCVQRGGRPPH